MPVTLIFSSAGPPAAGYVNDATGSYNPIWWVGLVLMLAGALVLLMTQPPKKGRSESVDRYRPVHRAERDDPITDLGLPT